MAWAAHASSSSPDAANPTGSDARRSSTRALALLSATPADLLLPVQRIVVWSRSACQSFQGPAMTLTGHLHSLLDVRLGLLRNSFEHIGQSALMLAGDLADLADGVRQVGALLLALMDAVPSVVKRCFITFHGVLGRRTVAPQGGLAHFLGLLVSKLDSVVGTLLGIPLAVEGLQLGRGETFLSL